MRKQHLFLPLIALVFLAVAQIAYGDEVKTDYNHSADFSQFHTYSWGDVKMANPFYVDRVKQDIDQVLQSKGWQMVPSGGAVTIFAHGNIKNQQELETFYNGAGWGGRWGWGGWGWRGPGFVTTTTTNQPVGNLVIDIFSGQSKDLLWRGMVQRDLSKKEDANTKALNKDIDKMFKDFPPKSKG
jgi:hypothetical protein